MSETQKSPSRIRLGAAVLALALVGLAAAPGARADDGDDAYRRLTTLQSEIELGVLFNSREDYKWGDYTGLSEDGFKVLGGADLRGRSAWDADVPWHYRLRGLNLGLDSRYVDALVEMPGLFGFEFWYDEIPKLQSDSARTPFRNLDSTLLLLPPGWVPGSNGTPAQMTQLESSLRDFTVDHRRRSIGGAGSLVLPAGFDFDASYQHQTKRGNRITAGMFGRNGGDPRAVLIPEEVDYVFHTIESNLSYAGDGFQARLQYYGSGFENEHDQTRWQDPFTAAGSYDPSAAYPNFGQKGQMPDNWFHQGVFSAGVDLPANSRLMVNTAFGWGRQDDSFLPYSINEALFDTPIAFGLPRDSLDGKVRTGMASLRFVSRPLPKLGISVGYRWNERDNDTPVDTYFRILADTGSSGGADQNPADRRINRPYGHDKHKVDVDVSYRLPKRTKLTLTYDFEHIRRDFEEVDQSDEHAFGAKLVSQVHPRVNVGVRFQRSYRDEDHYDCVGPFVDSEPPALLADPGCNPGQEFENNPQLRKFNQTDRRRWDANLWTNFALLDTLSLGAKVQYTLDDYFNSELGLVERRNLSAGADLSWYPTEALLFHLFYDYDEGRGKQDSLDWVGFGPPSRQDPFDPTNGWSTRDTDEFHTAGAGFEWRVIPDRLTIGADYLFTRSREILDTRVNSNLTEGNPFPDATTELHDISLRGEVRVTEQLSVRVGYLWERFKSRDWQIDQVCVGCLDFSGNSSVLALGEESPAYSAHLGSVSVIFRY